MKQILFLLLLILPSIVFSQTSEVIPYQFRRAYVNKNLDEISKDSIFREIEIDIIRKTIIIWQDDNNYSTDRHVLRIFTILKRRFFDQDMSKMRDEYWLLDRVTKKRVHAIRYFPPNKNLFFFNYGSSNSGITTLYYTK
jgi:hypothetical protein